MLCMLHPPVYSMIKGYWFSTISAITIIQDVLILKKREEIDIHEAASFSTVVWGGRSLAIFLER